VVQRERPLLLSSTFPGSLVVPVIRLWTTTYRGWLEEQGVQGDGMTGDDLGRLSGQARKLGFRLIDYPTTYLLWRVDQPVPDYALYSAATLEDVSDILEEIERLPRYGLRLVGNPRVSTAQMVNGFVTVTDTVLGESFTLWPGESARKLVVHVQDRPRIGNWERQT
jgi:hypothetical protein